MYSMYAGSSTHYAFRIMSIKLLPAFIFIVLLITACGTQQKDRKLSYVNDHAFLLTDEQEAKLTEKARELEESIGSQIFILAIDSLAGETIEAYSLRIANAWRIGRIGYDDGILITVALRERQMRIEVGSGLEKIIKDEVAAQIIREELVENFRAENYYEGLSLAVERIVNLIKENRQLVGER
jgi:uncharacterized membrane protein YgcG